MKNYEQVLKRFKTLLHKNKWPQTLWITPGMYWDVIIASEGEILADWRFHPRHEDVGFPFFLIGPTMVRPSKQANSANVTEFTETREEKFVEASEAMIDEGGPVDARSKSEKTS